MRAQRSASSFFGYSKWAKKFIGYNIKAFGQSESLKILVFLTYYSRYGGLPWEILYCIGPPINNDGAEHYPT